MRHAFVVVAACLPVLVGAQAPQGERTANNAVFVELAGNGGVYSLNYERFFGDVGLRIGSSYASSSSSEPANSSSVSLTTFPILGNYYLGDENDKLQLGAGIVLAKISGHVSDSFDTFSGSAAGAIPTAVVGYRHMPRTGGFDFGIALTPFLSGGVHLSGGLSLGAIF